jgi:hypothetical protein
MQRFQHQSPVANPDLELLRLEEALRLARDRLARMIRMIPDPAALKAAEDLCAEASTAVHAYTAMLRAPQRPSQRPTTVAKL